MFLKVLQDLQKSPNKVFQKQTQRTVWESDSYNLDTSRESLAYYAKLFKTEKNKGARTMEHDRT